MRPSIAAPSPFRALSTSCRSSSSRWAFCGEYAYAVRAATERLPVRRRVKSHPLLEPEHSRGSKILQVHLRWTQHDTNICSLAFAASKPLEPRQGGRIESVAEVAPHPVDVRRRHELGEEGPRGQDPHLHPGRPAHGLVGRDDGHLLSAPPLGGEPFDERVRVLGPAHLERAVALVGTEPIEHEHTARALRRHPARQQIAQLLRRAEAARVEEVEAVEEIEGRLSRLFASALRREERRRRRLRSATRPDRAAVWTPRDHRSGARAAAAPFLRRRTRTRPRRRGRPSTWVSRSRRPLPPPTDRPP